MHVLAVAGEDQLVFDRFCLGESDQRRIAVHAQQHVSVRNCSLQNRVDGVLRAIVQHRIQMMAVAVAGDQDRRLFAGQAWLFSLAAALPRLARQAPLTFPALQNETFVDLDDAGQPLVLKVFLRLQKTMPPAEGRALVDPGPHRRGADGLRAVERFGEFQPAVPLSKPGQRRAGQSVERPGAGQAFVTPQTPRHTMAMDATPLAMRAFQIGLKLAIDELLRFISSAPLAKSIDQLAALRGREFREKFR